MGRSVTVAVLWLLWACSVSVLGYCIYMGIVKDSITPFVMKAFVPCVVLIFIVPILAYAIDRKDVESGTSLNVFMFNVAARALVGCGFGAYGVIRYLEGRQVSNLVVGAFLAAGLFGEIGRYVVAFFRRRRSQVQEARP